MSAEAMVADPVLAASLTQALEALADAIRADRDAA
jgi:hypothetical protein